LEKVDFPEPMGWISVKESLSHLIGLHLTGSEMIGHILSVPSALKSSDAGNLLKNSTIYREFLAEREEILRHKWMESEKAGRDIGFERALLDWMMKHRTAWRRARLSAKGMS
jgi:hypothetical protein